MFGSDKKSMNAAIPGGITLISEQSTFKGDLRFTGGQVRIEGRVVGSVVAEAGAGASIEICTKGAVEGEVHGPMIVIDGQVHGNIVSTERVSLLSKARIHGNLFYKVLEMAAGAQVNGQIRRVEEGTVIDARAQVSAPALVTPAPATATVAEPLQIESTQEPKSTMKVETGNESNIAVTPTPVREGRHKRDK
ncbi:MAG: polymer-forming cytoskeletal protein [Ahniella sp.]|nr:polymer-forming cytoskeletal protein [Ahniella sp.]